MIKSLYFPFRRWTEKGTLWVYSDPHFSDPEMVELRTNYIGDDEQIARINSKVGKYDTIIFLGDIGNVEMIRKIRGYKVLIMGNHDKGVANYERQIEKIKFDTHKYTKDEAYYIMTKKHPGWRVTIHHDYDLAKAPFDFWAAEADNELFDEVYEGPLFISEKLVLSHEPVVLSFAFNIHGHEHRHVLRDHHFNVCAEHINYYPVNLDREIKRGLLSKVDSIHRITIDRATEKKNRRESRKADLIKFADEGDKTPVFRHGGSYDIPCLMVDNGLDRIRELEKQLGEANDKLEKAYHVIGQVVDQPNPFMED